MRLVSIAKSRGVVAAAQVYETATPPAVPCEIFWYITLVSPMSVPFDRKQQVLKDIDRRIARTEAELAQLKKYKSAIESIQKEQLDAVYNYAKLGNGLPHNLIDLLTG